MYSRNIHNIDDVFEQFISTFNTFPEIKKCNKAILWNFILNHEKTFQLYFVVIQMILMQSQKLKISVLKINLNGKIKHIQDSKQI
jgi:hypothetical protein